jgi:hypothetical protein
MDGFGVHAFRRVNAHERTNRSPAATPDGETIVAALPEGPPDISVPTCAVSCPAELP